MPKLASFYQPQPGIPAVSAVKTQKTHPQVLGLPDVDPRPVPVVLQDDGLAPGMGRKCEDLLFS